MKKPIILIAICLIILSCNKNSETFNDIEFGKISRKTFLKQMLNDNQFSPRIMKQDGIADTIGYSYTWVNNGKKYPMGVIINEENFTSRYKFGAIRRIEFWVGEETDNSSFVSFGHKISKDNVDELFDSFIEVYGKPDSLMVKQEYIPDLYCINFGVKPKHKEIDKEYLPGKKAIWFKDNFKLVFEISPLKKGKSKSEKIYYQNGDESYIKIYFEMNNYEYEFKRIQDSIAKTFKPKDLVTVINGRCNWSSNYNEFKDSRLRIDIKSLMRNDLEDPRKIKGVRFDLIIEDSFRKEMYRYDDLTIELPKGNYLESRPDKNESGQRMIVDVNKTFYVDFSSLENSKLAKLKKYSMNNELIVKTKVNSILFEDGSILTD